MFLSLHKSWLTYQHIGVHIWGKEHPSLYVFSFSPFLIPIISKRKWLFHPWCNSLPQSRPLILTVSIQSQSVCCVWDGNSTIYLWPIVSHPNDALETFMMVLWLISFVECLPEDVGGVLLFYNTVGIRSVSMPNFRGGIPIFENLVL